MYLFFIVVFVVDPRLRINLHVGNYMYWSLRLVAIHVRAKIFGGGYPSAVCFGYIHTTISCI